MQQTLGVNVRSELTEQMEKKIKDTLKWVDPVTTDVSYIASKPIKTRLGTIQNHSCCILSYWLDDIILVSKIALRDHYHKRMLSKVLWPQRTPLMYIVYTIAHSSKLRVELFRVQY